MSSETNFEYRHKKFDHRKRIREDDSLPFGSGSNSTVLDYSDTSKNSFLTTAIIPEPKKQKSIEIIEQVKPPNPFERADNELRQRIQLINLPQHLPPIAFPSLDRPISITKYEDKDRVLIKTEIVEPNECSSSASSIPKQCRKRTRSGTVIKEEPSAYSDVKIKQELIEINTHLPAIPREAYEDICKFRSNMVRKFPKKDRSAKEQERRDKNTYACRKSRRVKKIEQVAVEEEYKSFKNANLRMAEYAIRAAAYFKELMKMSTEEKDSEIIVVD